MSGSLRGYSTHVKGSSLANLLASSLRCLPVLKAFVSFFPLAKLEGTLFLNLKAGLDAINLCEGVANMNVE